MPRDWGKSLGVYDFYHLIFNIPRIYHNNLDLDNLDFIESILNLLCEDGASAISFKERVLKLFRKRYQEQVLGLVRTRLASRK